MALEKTAGGAEIQFYRSTGSENTVYSTTGTENTVYSTTGTEKGYPLTTFLFFRAYQKTGYPLTTNNIAKLYLFVNGYTRSTGTEIQRTVLLGQTIHCTVHWDEFLRLTWPLEGQPSK